MKQRKSLFIAVCTLAGVLATALFVRVYYRFASTTAAYERYENNTVIIIDAGHGGFDPGAEYGGIAEKDVNLNIALRLKEFFAANGYVTVLTRTQDVSTSDPGLPTIREQKRSDLRNRVALANSFPGAVYISIHQNAFSDQSQNGSQTFYGSINTNSEPLAQAVQNALCALVQPQNRRGHKSASDAVYIAQNITCPMIIVECGFISNNAERGKLLDNEYCSVLAFAIYSGFCAYQAQLNDS